MITISSLKVNVPGVNFIQNIALQNNLLPLQGFYGNKKISNESLYHC